MKKVNLILLVMIISSILSSLTIANAKNKMRAGDDFFDSRHNKQINYSFKNKSEVKLSYKKSRKLLKDNKNEKKLHIYNDDKGTEYFFNEADNLTGIRFSDTMTNKVEKLDFKDIEKNAKEFFNKTVDKNYYQYLNYEYNKKSNEYSFIWKKYINNIETEDFVIIDIDDSGKIHNFVRPNSNLYSDEEALIKKTYDYIKKQEAQEILNAHMNEMSNNSILKFTDYKEIDSAIYFDENKRLVWEFTVELKFGDSISVKSIKIDANTKEILE